MNLLNILTTLTLCSMVWAQVPPYRPKTDGGVSCMIPFEYKGETFHDCTTAGGSTPWCRPAADSWGYCAPGADFSTCNVATPSVNVSEVAQIVQLMNNIRSKEPALRMSKLRWNTELAQRAQYMSNQCKLGSDNTNLCTSKNSMGQFSFMSMSSDVQPKKWSQFILEFYNKRTTYNIETNVCSGQYCNGYKQLVNAKTTEVGCGVTSCNRDSSYTDYYFCNFYPPIYQGKPYDKGDAKCDSCYKLNGAYAFRCTDSLCDICDSPSSDCQGIDQLIGSGKVCEDTDPQFCNLNASICPDVDLLPDDQKAMVVSKCKRTCKFCQ